MVLLSIFPAVRILKKTLLYYITVLFFYYLILCKYFSFSSQNYYCHAQDEKYVCIFKCL